ncbi:DUF4349 domain-containing protein [Flavobacterium hercynium]|uniref:DUF4349 domain-containing protein n=1 Tax=Flavobacterium hercynium TaxID=387094 RepID=A0A226HM88_9FLAO|nr:DUF4349 domain-containing protein [Flavobacterium hercynium]OXA94736.1 hypothetical protein B0A66_03135 [Flavobacterium hercynium]SMP07643.1 protein of unknown function [Flavobacterium hercynium]
MKYIFFLFFVFLTLSGCSKHEEPSKNMMITTVKLPPKKESSSSSEVNSNTSQITQKIIKEASLRFETNNLEDTFNQIQIAITANKATIQNDSEGKDYDNVYRNLTIRVPSQNFDSFINAISKGVSYFERKDISSQNVTEEYIDLTSRLNTKRKLEARYLEILQKATKISEILEIEKQISVIREEIEAKQGQLKYLENRVSESTVSISFYKTVAQKEGVKASYGSKIWTAIQSGFFSLSEFLISIISIWPFIILFCVIAYFIRKRFKRKKI